MAGEIIRFRRQRQGEQNKNNAANAKRIIPISSGASIWAELATHHRTGSNSNNRTTEKTEREQASQYLHTNHNFTILISSWHRPPFSCVSHPTGHAYKPNSESLPHSAGLPSLPTSPGHYRPHHRFASHHTFTIYHECRWESCSLKALFCSSKANVCSFVRRRVALSCLVYTVVVFVIVSPAPPPPSPLPSPFSTFSFSSLLSSQFISQDIFWAINFCCGCHRLCTLLLPVSCSLCVFACAGDSCFIYCWPTRIIFVTIFNLGRVVVNLSWQRTFSYFMRCLRECERSVPFHLFNA